MRQLSSVVRSQDQRLRRLRLEIVRGAELSALLADELDQLADRCDAPAMARSSWLAATVIGVPTGPAWAVAVRDGHRVLRAAVVLLDEIRADRTVVTLAGCATGHSSAVLADSPEAAALLGYGFARALQQRPSPVWAVLGPVRQDAAWLAEFVGTIPGGEVVIAEAVPVVRRATSSCASDYLSASVQRSLRKAANRARTDGASVTISFTRDSQQVASLLPTLEQMHRDRDHDQGRRSELDDPIGRQIWRSRLEGLAGEEMLEVGLLCIGDSPAAQVIGIVEPKTYRVLEGVLMTRSRDTPRGASWRQRCCRGSSTTQRCRLSTG
ncbi:MAG: GNAT family N-acetyltransferase [Actinomycetota bacterium]|nr:GNAT family N-acetyltransferase [Actinomycetota bacterium]